MSATATKKIQKYLAALRKKHIALNELVDGIVQGEIASLDKIRVYLKEHKLPACRSTTVDAALKELKTQKLFCRDAIVLYEKFLETQTRKSSAIVIQLPNNKEGKELPALSPVSPRLAVFL